MGQGSPREAVIPRQPHHCSSSAASFFLHFLFFYVPRPTTLYQSIFNQPPLLILPNCKDFVTANHAAAMFVCKSIRIYELFVLTCGSLSISLTMIATISARASLHKKARLPEMNAALLASSSSPLRPARPFSSPFLHTIPTSN